MTAIPARKAPALGGPATGQRGPVAPSCAVPAVSTANRQAMPQVAAAVDQLREIFGPIQVVFAAEGGKVLGQAPDPGVIAHPPPIPNNKRKARTEERSTPAARTSHDGATMVER